MAVKPCPEVTNPQLLEHLQAWQLQHHPDEPAPAPHRSHPRKAKAQLELSLATGVRDKQKGFLQMC